MWSKIISRALINRNKQLVARSYSDSISPTLLRKYQHFQQDNGIPVYLKGGPMDKVLFGITISLIGVGLADGFWCLFQMAKPKKK